MIAPIKKIRAVPRILGQRVHRFRAGTSNALELLREGRLTAPWSTPFSVLHEDPRYKLRRYVNVGETEVEPVRGPLLLVPPLMIASEIYDLAPELSAVAWLTAQGVDVWLVDFGAPELQEGALQRTLDDHVLAVDDAIDRVREATGQDVNLAGYSQGGMFVYQCAAYRQSHGVQSVITFGSPVDIHRNLPGGVRGEVSEVILGGPGKAVLAPFRAMEALPGAMSMAGFKILSGGKEIRQMLGIFSLLPDREALERRERQRRFLGGEGFVAWPGPALRKFIDEMIVNNRMLTGGFVINGRTVTLADIDVPILYFVGSRDEFGRPPSVRAINDAAPRATVHEVELAAGHFGLVVGSKSLRYTWPTVVSWIRWLDGDGPQPDFQPEARPEPPPEVEDRRGIQRLYDSATSMLDNLWHRVGDVSLEVGELVDALRWELPRLARIRRLEESTPVSMGSVLAEQARAIPDAAFFLWEDQAYTYAEADREVSRVAAALFACGIEPGAHVGIQMDNHPDFLTATAALNRIGAVAVLLNGSMRGSSLEHALIEGGVAALISDHAHVEDLAATCPDLPLFVFGAENEVLPDVAIRVSDHVEDEPDLSKVDLNPGRAGDVAMLIFTSGTTGRPKAVKITNRRWSLAALSTAAIGKFTTRDTVYCCTPLYHATGMLMASGGALVGGARLALASGFSATRFLEETRRYGATVVFYVGEMCRYLVNREPQPGEDRHSIRLFIGNGMRPDVWRDLQERFKPGKIIEFYGSTEGNVAMVNMSGEKIGSVGQPLNQDRQVALVHYDVEFDDYIRADDGFMEACGVDEPGVLLARIDPSHPLSLFDGYTSEEETERKILRDVFKKGDAWFSTGDLMRRDGEGDYWFLDRVGDSYRWRGENVSSEQVADVISELPFVENAVVYGVRVTGREGRAGTAAIQLREGASFDGDAAWRAVSANLTESARPRFIRIVERLETTETMKFVKFHLRAQGIDPERIGDPMFFYSAADETYLPFNDPECISQVD